ncbi:MAG: 50S ribosomal protein L7/L12, partial [Spirochaetes bacterium]|nr:50S ribosomal protein L7/L12 [Spirochaetota bacterium]
MTKEDFIKEIKSMTVVELNDLVEAIKTEFGVTAAVA